MMDEEDRQAAEDAGYELGFSTPAEDVPPRDTWTVGDERHQAWVSGFDSGQNAQAEAARNEAERRAFFDEFVKPVVEANLSQPSFEQREKIRKARIAELGEANRAASAVVPQMEPATAQPAPDLAAQQVARYRSQSRQYQPFRSHASQARELTR